jgi:hypothetical protein
VREERVRYLEPDEDGIGGCEDSNIKFACCECGAIFATEFVQCERPRPYEIHR